MPILIAMGMLCISQFANAALVWNGTAWAGDNYENIVIDDTYISNGVANFASVNNYGSIKAGSSLLDFQGINYGSITASGNNLTFFSTSNYGSVNAAYAQIAGNFINNGTLTADRLIGESLQNNGTLVSTSSLRMGDFLNYGSATLGKVETVNFSNFDTGQFSASSVNASNIAIDGHGLVSGAITSENMGISGILYADSVTMWANASGTFGVATDAVLNTTNSLNLVFADYGGNASVLGTVNAGGGVYLGELNDPYNGYTLGGTGVINGNVYIAPNGRLLSGLKINGDVINLGSPISPVPEPSEWAMLAVGLAVIGCAAKRRTRKDLHIL